MYFNCSFDIVLDEENTSFTVFALLGCQKYIEKDSGKRNTGKTSQNIYSVVNGR